MNVFWKLLLAAFLLCLLVGLLIAAVHYVIIVAAALAVAAALVALIRSLLTGRKKQPEGVVDKVSAKRVERTANKSLKELERKIEKREF